MQHAALWEPEIEYLAGREVPKVSPRRAHGVVQANVVQIVQRCARELGGTVATEWRFAINADGDPRTSLVPDVAFLSNERLAALDEEAREEPPFAPDVAIEVRSPSDRIADVEWKMAAYLAHGALLALDVIPADRVVRAFTREGMRVFSEGERFASDAAPWLQFNARDAFCNI
ncbi:MAG TPA: Uma2 family endonuclease [Candidatus Dormibacteraeota bacterium]|nr:Uma2 family endonuclease [Candidatus Dormibacteraeota bacterium]